MARERKKSLRSVLILLVIVLLLGAAAAAYFLPRDRYTAATMRLLRFEGEVRIQDAAGKIRTLLENAKSRSGETMSTGTESLASVGLDDTKIVTLDELSRAEFRKENSRISLHLTEGTLVCDVREKLKDNESFDIRTSTMVIGIRGTYIIVRSDGMADSLIVLEGIAEVTWKDPLTGEERVTSVPAGKVFSFGANLNENGMVVLSEKNGTAAILTDATLNQIPEFAFREAYRDETVAERVMPAFIQTLVFETEATRQEHTGLKQQFVQERTVVLRAESAEKTYDGLPLTAGYTVSCPDGMRVEAATDGVLTDVGEIVNGFASYRVFDENGLEVTAECLVDRIPGMLRISPAELTVKTGDAYKTYDGFALSNPEAELNGLVNGETATIRTTGMITSIGSIDNEYVIEWGTAKAGNYIIVEEDLGTLTVRAPASNGTGGNNTVGRNGQQQNPGTGWTDPTGADAGPTDQGATTHNPWNTGG